MLRVARHSRPQADSWSRTWVCSGGYGQLERGAQLRALSDSLLSLAGSSLA